MSIFPEPADQDEEQAIRVMDRCNENRERREFRRNLRIAFVAPAIIALFVWLAWPRPGYIPTALLTYAVCWFTWLTSKKWNP